MNSELNQSVLLEAEMLGIQNVAQTDHSKLDNLDYENSGHTGFAPAGDYVEDSNYVHTDNNYTDTEKNKLANLENYDDTEIKRDIQSLEDTKVDKEVNKGLSTNDYTTDEKNKLAGLSNYDDTEIKGDISSLQTNKADKTEIPDVSNFITKSVNDLTYYTLATATGSTIELSINSSTYVMTLNLKNSAGTTISTGTVDLPLESVVVSGSYDDTTKEIILTLQSGSTVEFSVADLVSGLQSEITSSNKLSSDLVDDSNSTNKFFSGNYNDLSNKPTIPDELADLSDDSTHRLVTDTEKTTWNSKYDKPSGGIPDTDLSSAVQTSLGKADTALQSETYTGTITSVKMNGTTISSSGEADLGTVITSHQDISGKENTSNKVTSMSSSSTDTQYPSAKAVYDALQNAGGGSSGNAQHLGYATDYSTSSTALDITTLKKGIYMLSASKWSNSIPQYLYIKTQTSTGTKTGSISFTYRDIAIANTIFLSILNDYPEPSTISTTDNILIGYLSYSPISNTSIYSQERPLYVNVNGLVSSSFTVQSKSYVNDHSDQYISGVKTFSSVPKCNINPTDDNHLTRKRYVDTKITTYSGYDATKTQVLKNVNGTLTWITEE